MDFTTDLATQRMRIRRATKWRTRREGGRHFHGFFTLRRKGAEWERDIITGYCQYFSNEKQSY